ncbi:MAG: response regulator transcription factor [Mycoplasmatales bacterium]
MKILIVEDEKIIRDYIKLSLKEHQQLTEATNVEQALAYLKENSYELILSDILMANQTGFDLLTYVKKANLNIPIIMISALNDENNLIKAYDLGAIDYITKPINKEILQKKVKNLKNYLTTKVEQLVINEAKREVLVEGQDIELTKIEYEIFILLYKNSPRIYTKENLIDIIWHANYSMSEKIIDVNIFNIRKKLKQYAKILKTKRGIGYYLEN